MPMAITLHADTQTLERRFVAVLRSVLAGRTGVALHEPEFAGNEWAYLRECIDTGWVSSAGKLVDEFELRLAETTGSRVAVATVNGTAALQDEVLVPALSFVASANAAAHCGGIPRPPSQVRAVPALGEGREKDPERRRGFFARLTGRRR